LLIIGRYLYRDCHKSKTGLSKRSFGWDKTYGKGTVQNWNPLQGNNGAIRITVARSLTPKVRLIDENGLLPEYEIELNEDDIKVNRDFQKEKAVMLFENIYHSNLVP
jgi:C-terminal processing protease CtpA/Prc